MNEIIEQIMQQCDCTEEEAIKIMLWTLFEQTVEYYTETKSEPTP